VTGLDWIIVAFAAILAAFGFRRGFIVGVLSFAGFALGAFLGTRLAPLLLTQGSSSPYAPAFGLFGAILAGAILASGARGIGFRVRRALLLPGIGALDGLLGAALGVALALGVVWIVAAVVAQAPNATRLREDIQRSAILGELNALLPPSGSILNALARLDPLPSISGPSPDVPPPPARIAHAPSVRRASASVVRVLGTACGLAIEGSGWVAAPGEVVTNAHVVAGERDTTVEPGGHAPTLPARVLAYDPREDIAVLGVPGLEKPALELVGDPQAGEAGAILGYPENGPFDARSARIGSCGPATPAVRSSTAPAACSRRSSPAPSAVARTAATAWPTRPSRACSQRPPPVRRAGRASAPRGARPAEPRRTSPAARFAPSGYGPLRRWLGDGVRSLGDCSG